MKDSVSTLIVFIQIRASKMILLSNFIQAIGLAFLIGIGAFEVTIANRNGL